MTMRYPHRILALLFSIALSLLIFLRIITDTKPSRTPTESEIHRIIKEDVPSQSLNYRENTINPHDVEDAPPCLNGRNIETLLLVQALRDGRPEEVQDTAAKLRNRLRANPHKLEQLSQLLLDPSTPLQVFANIALISGSLDSSTATQILLDALDRFQNHSERAEWLLYALGTWKQKPGWDQRFAFDPDGPMVLQSREGLSTPLFHRFTKPSIYSRILPFLDESSPDLRAAAILTLRHSLANARIREAFARTLQWETDPGNQANLAEALAREAVKLPSKTVRETISLIIEKATQPDALAIRLKVQSPLQGLPLFESQKKLLEDLATNPSMVDSSIRRFALALLANRNTVADSANLILWKTATNDPDPNIRGAAIEHLRNYPVPPPTSRLVPILDSDPDWNVRYAIVETLAHIPSEDDAHNALNALKNTAQKDPHPKVAAKAQSILYGEQ